MEKEKREECFNFLKGIQVKSLQRKELVLIDVQEDTPISECLRIMNQNNILSLPVYAKAKEEELSKEYIGVVNLFELLVPLAFKPYFESDVPDQEYFKTDFESDKLNQPVSDWLGTSKEGEYLWSAKSIDSVYSLIERMSKGVHRYLVEDREEGKTIYKLVTQSDFLRFLRTHKKELKPILSVKVKDLNIIKQKDLKVIKSSLTAVEGLREMYRENISGIGIVDDDGKLIGNYSLSDLRGISGKNISNLLKPVNEYLTEQRGNKEIVSCGYEDTIEDVVEKMLDKKVHRLWIVDEQGKPQSVCTMSNLHYAFF